MTAKEAHEMAIRLADQCYGPHVSITIEVPGWAVCPPPNWLGVDWTPTDTDDWTAHYFDTMGLIGIAPLNGG